MLNEYHEKLLALALVQSELGRVRTLRLFGEATKPERWCKHFPGKVEVTRVKEEIERLTKNAKLVDGMVVERVGDNFYLDSGDRNVCLTEEFLSTCAPDWAERLRKTMREWEG